MSQLRKLQRSHDRQEAEAEEAGVPDHHLKLPVGKVISAPVKGDFLSIPLFGWVGKRVKVQTPLVMLAVLLIRSLEDPTVRGTLELELPVFEDTELATLAALERYGWDGRVWPLNEGWPDGNAEEEANLRALMGQAGLGSTLTFPPGEGGYSAQAVTVTRARGPFLMAPLPEPEGEPDLFKLEKLRELCQNPSMLLNNPLRQ